MHSRFSLVVIALLVPVLFAAGDSLTQQRSLMAAPGCNNNGTCAGTETPGSCPNDCDDSCGGDALCTGTETPATCPSECDDSCGGDGLCTGSETAATCPSECAAGVCPDGTCDPGETCATCADCQTGCGDGCCVGTETAATCPTDCSATCPDGVCSGSENSDTCAADCPDTCGDGYCSSTEDTTSCAGDCPPAPTNFASCDFDLPDCTDSRTDCCKRSMDPVGTDRAIIIPMDRCHQKFATSGKAGPPGSGSPEWCVEMGTSADKGVTLSYGLIYRLMQAGIPVHWAIDPSKDPQGRGAYTHKDVDFWVLSAGATPPDVGDALTDCSGACVAPVVRLNNSDLSVAATYTKQELPVRGSAFIIAPEDRDEFNKFWLKQAPYNVAPYTDPNYDFSLVDLYELQDTASITYQEYHNVSGAGFVTQAKAPIAVKIDYDPPRLIKQSGGPSDTWLAEAQLDDPATNGDCLTAAFQPFDAVYCPISIAEVGAGDLNTADATWAWFDKGGFSCTDVDEFRTFMTAVPDTKDGGSALFMEGVVTDIENCSGKEIAGALTVGLNTQSSTISAPYIQRHPANLFAQWGDFEADFASGSVSGWFDGFAGYEPRASLIRLVTQDSGTLCADNISTSACDNSSDVKDLAMYVRHDDIAENGIAFYAGGNNITQSGNLPHLRMVLNALISIPASVVDSTPDRVVEISRSSPVATEIDATEVQVQGSFEKDLTDPAVTTYASAGDNLTFTFPHVVGHMRAIDTSSISTTDTTNFVDTTAVFDAAIGIPAATPAGCGPAAFGGTCRTVFTNTVTGANPARVLFDQSSNATLEAALEGTTNLSSAEIDVLISRVLAGHSDGGAGFEPKLGGVDRSTTAVIQSSPITGNTRPKMAYFGALDGMLHAVCAEVLAPCTSLGQELWAYIPRTQLPNLRLNTQRVDGSPTVSDVFADFDGDGQREWKTILVFQTGSGDAGSALTSPVVVALDITDPEDPLVVWERTMPGKGMNVALGPVQVGSVTKYVAFATSNKGSAASGIYVSAIDMADGSEIWNFDHTYPSLARTVGPDVPKSGIPAGPSAFDLDNVNLLTHLVVPTLYGDVWVFDTSDGSNVFGTQPMFRFSTNHHPIGASAAIFRDAGNTFHIVIGSGGYADPISLTTWSPAGHTQYVVSMSMDLPVADAPLDETTASPFRDFLIDLGAGNRVFAAPTIAGNELFIVTDSTDVNNLAAYGLGTATGSLNRYSLTDGSAKGAATVLAGGASAVDVRGGKVFSGSAQGAQITDVSDDFDASGISVELQPTSQSDRMLWLMLR
jgi:hypothetical protein